MPRTCFVVSPIGEPDTPARKLADDLLELIVDPALESLGFTIIRADKMVGSVSITSDIVNLVQSADLCIIDLTGHNANVFYECGRRHETARPFIQVMRRGEKPPFDVAGIRTIFYDISDAREVRNTVLEVRRYAEAVIRNTSSMTHTSMSAASIADALDRLERKIDQISTGRGLPNLRSPSSPGDPLSRRKGKLNRTVSPQEMYLRAVAQEDWEGAAEATEVMKERHGLKSHVLAAAATIARVGQSTGATILYEALDGLPPWISDEDPEFGQANALTALSRYYVSRDQEEIGLAKLQGKISELFFDDTVPAEGRARLANSIEMLAYGAKDYALGVEWGTRACEMMPDEVTYWSNLSMCYESQGNMVKAKDAIDRGLVDPLEQSDAGVLDQAIDVYSSLGDKEMVESLFTALDVQDAESAAFKRFLMDRDSE